MIFNNTIMENSNKYSTNQKPSFASEPETVYETKQEIIQQKNTPEQEILLQKLLKLGNEQIERGETFTNEEVWKEIELKFNFKRNG